MANVSMRRFHDRPRLPYAVNAETAKLYSPLRRTKNEIPGQRVIKHDVSDTLQEAALINIVAAVNEDIHGYPVAKPDVTVPGSAIDSLKNTVAVISHLMTPRHRSVSIPQPQKVFNMADGMVQKKPMYYRHSEDDNRIHKVSEQKADSSKGKVNASVSEELTCPSPVQSVKIMPVKTYNDSDFKVIDEDLRKKSNRPAKHSATSRESRISAVRRLGTLKSRTRTVHEVSKCDAVDLMDTNTSLFDSKQASQDPAKAILDDSRKVIPIAHAHTEPYARPKSLPGAFPAKSKKFTRVKSSPAGKQQQHVYKNKNPIATSISRDTPQSLYGRMMTLPSGFGFESLAIGNGVNKEPDVFSPLSHDSTRVSNPRVSFTGLAVQRPGRRTGTPRTQLTVSGDSTWSAMSTFYDTEEDPEDVSRLHEAIESAMGRTSKAESVSENKENVASLYTTPKPELVRHSSVSTTSKVPRKVQFDSKEISMSSEESYGYEPPRLSVNGGSSILQPPMSTLRSYTPAIQPMSANELLRFKQRIFPANMHKQNNASKSYYAASSVMNIKRLYNKPAATTTKLELEDTDKDSDDDSDCSVEHLPKVMANETEETDPLKTTQDDSFIQDKNENDDSAHRESLEECENDQEKQDFYKLIKAIDTHSYSGFEHKKLRRVSDSGSARKSDDTKKKEHYVKVKLR